MDTDVSYESQFIQGSLDIDKIVLITQLEIIRNIYGPQTMDSRKSPDFKPENELFRKDLRDVLQWVLKMASENYSDENKKQSEVE